ncbi:MAG: hypothetical protein KAI02_08520 [Gammaproteobacteria bacterium]|nr:hypothetical protein [Gammaproteobacteria bacterium]
MKKIIQLCVLTSLLFYSFSTFAIGEFKTFVKGIINPTDLAIHPTDSALYIKSGTTGKVWSIPIMTNGSAGKIEQCTDIFIPNTTVKDEQGNIYKTNTDVGTITRLTPLGKSSIIASGLSSPTGIAYHPKTQLLFISETSNGEIKAIFLDDKIKKRYEHLFLRTLGH